MTRCWDVPLLGLLGPMIIPASLVMVTLGFGLTPPLLAAAEELSADELRMKERLLALSQGEGSVADLRIEGMDGGMAASTHFDIADGKVLRKRWEMPGSPAPQDERAVTDEQIRALLRELVAKEYWTFEGTHPIPDAPMFLFRFYYKDLQPVTYSCDAHEYEQSPQRSAIRDVLWAFVSGFEKPKPMSKDRPNDKVSCEALGGTWSRFGSLEEDDCQLPTADAGNPCTDSTQCQSACVTDDTTPKGSGVTGRCFDRTIVRGTCLNYVRSGTVTGVTCVD